MGLFENQNIADIALKHYEMKMLLATDTWMQTKNKKSNRFVNTW